MNPIIELFAYTALAGTAIPLGGFLASIEHIGSRWLREEFRHTVIAPQATLKNSSFPPLGAVLGFLLGLLGNKVMLRVAIPN